MEETGGLLGQPPGLPGSHRKRNGRGSHVHMCTVPVIEASLLVWVKVVFLPGGYDKRTLTHKAVVEASQSAADNLSALLYLCRSSATRRLARVGGLAGAGTRQWGGGSWTSDSP